MRIAIAIAASFAVVACSSSKAEAPSAVDVYSTGVPGQAAAARTHKMTATVVAVDTATRKLTLRNTDGSIDTVDVPPEVKRLNEIAAGDTVVVEVQEGILFEYLPPGSPYAAPAAAAATGIAPRTERPAAGAIAAVQSTVTITAVNLETRVVEFQDLDGFKHHVKAGPGLAIEKLVIGDRLAATYVATAAASVEKAKP